MHLSVIGSEQILLMCHNVSHVMRKETSLYLYLKYISVILETWDKKELILAKATLNNISYQRKVVFQ